MSILILSTPVAGASDEHDEVVAARLELLIARLVVKQVSGQIGYWAAFADERAVSHYAFTSDPTYADLSPENAASRARAVVGLGRAIERQRAMLESVAPTPVAARRRR